MDSQIPLLTFFLFLLLTRLRFANCAPYTPICTQTPHPDLCASLVNSSPQTTSLVENLLDLHKTSLTTTLAQAQNAYKLISNMDLSPLDELARSAWADCLDLYEDSIYQLNQSIGSENDANALTGAQTWLSAAIANEQTCQNGFLDFNLSKDLLQSAPFMQTNFSKFLSNSLAINKAMSLSSSSSSSSSSSPLDKTKPNKNRRLLSVSKYINNNDFPEWVSAGDRKLLQSPAAAAKADAVVAQDGSGNYKTISEALAASAKLMGTTRFVIYVKKGIYKENVEVKRSMKNLMLIGDGIDATVVSGSKNVKDGSTTFRSATFAVMGGGFIAREMTFENTAGPQKHQAVAFRSGSDLSALYKCSFKGYQDTLYLYSQRQFYRECDIYGTIDFIFGDAAAVIQNSNIYALKPMSSGQWNTVTAQARKDPNENTGIVIHDSNVITSAASGYKTYLGRPWQKFSRTVFMKCSIDGGVDPAGWLAWSGDFGLSTLYYGEYMNRGRGAGTGGRVRWPGFHVISSTDEAGKFAAGRFLGGDAWIPATGVPFTSGL